MSDHPLRPALFRADAIAEDTAKVNDGIVELMTGLPDWWIVGAEVDPRSPPPGPRPVSRAGQVAARPHHRDHRT